MAKKVLFLAFGLDALLLLALGLYFLYNKLVGKPFVRGFFCDDTTISFPVKDDSVSWVTTLVIAGLVPLFFIIVTELILKKINGDARSTSFIQSLSLYLGPFIGGFFFEHMFVEVAKFNVGRLRPNFLSACRPYFEIGGVPYDCSNTTTPNGYVGSYECLNSDYRESLLSFPSGHTSLITYAMVYGAGYLQMRMPKVTVSYLMKPFLQFGLLLIAWWISLSRVSDYKHHWSDVLAGGLIGTFAAFVALHYVRMWSKKLSQLPTEETGLVGVNRE